jgi:hypothetical protein
MNEQRGDINKVRLMILRERCPFRQDALAPKRGTWPKQFNTEYLIGVCGERSLPPLRSIQNPAAHSSFRHGSPVSSIRPRWSARRCRTPLLDSDKSQPDANPFSPAMPIDAPIVTEGKVSRAWELHPDALPELDVNLSAHPAPVIQSLP